MSARQAILRNLSWRMLANDHMQERERVAEEQEKREKDIAVGNPLLNPTRDYNVKRR